MVDPITGAAALWLMARVLADAEDAGWAAVKRLSRSDSVGLHLQRAATAAIRAAVSEASDRLTEEELDDVVAIFDMWWPSVDANFASQDTMLEAVEAAVDAAIASGRAPIDLGPSHGVVSSLDVLQRDYSIEIDGRGFGRQVAEQWSREIRLAARTTPSLATFAIELGLDQTVRELRDDLITLLSDAERRAVDQDSPQRTSDWVPLEGAYFPLLKISTPQVERALLSFALALLDEPGLHPVVFTMLCRLDSWSTAELGDDATIAPEPTSVPVLQLVSPHRRPAARGAELHRGIMQKIVAMAIEGSAESRLEAEAAVKRHFASTESWDIRLPDEITYTYWTPLRVDVDPDLQRITMESLDGRADALEYRSGLQDTSDALEYFAATTTGGFGYFGSVEALADNPAALRMLAYLFDTMNADPSPFRVRRAEPERWDFEYSSFDREVALRKRQSPN